MDNKTEVIEKKITRLNSIKMLSNSLENWSQLAEGEKKSLKQNILTSLEKQNYPFYEGNSEVTLIYKGHSNIVELLSDITGWTDPIQFKKIDGEIGRASCRERV